MHDQWRKALARIFVSGALSSLVGLAMIPFPASAQFDTPNRGWSMEVTDRFGQRQRCRLELSDAGSIFGGRRANVSGCGGAFMSVSQWQEGRRGLVLSDMSGRPLITLRRSHDGYFARSDGQSVRIRFGSSLPTVDTPFGPSFAPPTVSIPTTRGCSIYYGLSQRCARTGDTYAPRLAPGQSVSVRLVSPTNLRQAPALSAPLLQVMPLNTCLRAEACGPQADGSEWCRVRYGEQTGYITKLFERDGRRYILFSNACTP